MKLTNQEIFNAKAPLEKLLGEKFPLKVSHGLATLVTKLNDQLQVIDKVRQGLFQTYGIPNPQNPTQLLAPPAMIVETDNDGKQITDEAGNVTMVPNPKMQKFASEIEELLSIEVEIVLEPVTLPEKVAATCDKCGHNMDRLLEIEPLTLMKLEKFVKVA